jgi:uncharacterized protein YbaP (TraB family)
MGPHHAGNGEHANSERHRTRRRTTTVRACVLVWLVLAYAHAAAARDFVWKVTGKSGTLYLVGSVHLLTQDFYPLSSTLEGIYKDSDLLVEEADLGELISSQSQMQLLARGMLPSSQSLDQLVSPATLADVSKRVAQLGMPMEPLKRFKPWFLALTLSALEWQKAGFDAQLGIDRHFFDRAKKDNRRVMGLETVEFQMTLFDGLSADQQERLLVGTLKDLDTELANLSRMVQAWKTGDASTVEEIVTKDLKSEPVLYERLLAQRNRTWLPKLEPLLERSGRTLVVVGAAHLVGPDGLLAMLTAKGYRVEQM